MAILVHPQSELIREPRLLMPRQKPFGRVKVANVPLTLGLVNCYGFGGSWAGFGYDIAQKKTTTPAVSFGSPSVVSTPNGVGLWTPNGAAIELAIAEAYTAPITFAIHMKVQTPDQWGAPFALTAGASTGTFSVGKNGSADEWFFQINGSSAYTITGSKISTEIDKYQVFIFTLPTTAGSFTMHTFTGSFSGSGQTQNTTAGSLFIGCGRDKSATYDCDVVALAAYRWSRVLSAAEILALLVDFYLPVIPA